MTNVGDLDQVGGGAFVDDPKKADDGTPIPAEGARHGRSQIRVAAQGG